MRSVTFSVVGEAAAPPAAVFELLADAATWPTWSPIGAFALERWAPDGGEGLGAVRRFRTAGTTTIEEVTDFEADRRFGYRQLRGLPVHDHHAVVTLEPTPGGTRITWAEDFRTRVPGMGWFLKAFVRRCVRGLTAQAARQRASA